MSAPAAVVPPAVAVRPAGRQSVARQAVRLWRTRIGLGLLALLVLLAAGISLLVEWRTGRRPPPPGRVPPSPRQPVNGRASWSDHDRRS